MNNQYKNAAIDVDFYQESNGKKPAAQFMKKADSTTENILKKKLFQVQQEGLAGGEKRLTGIGAGLCEFRFFSGYIVRIFFMEKAGGILVLGISGKDGQDLEIEKCAARRQQYLAEVAVKKRNLVDDWKKNGTMLSPEPRRPMGKASKKHERSVRL